jgi:uncharacterized protein (DUF302 family)
MNSNEFYFKKSVTGNFEEVRSKVELTFKEVGFGVLSEIRMHEKFKEKLNIDFPPYVILGICNPKFAYESVQLEENIGVFLPCKIVLKQKPDNTVQVLVLDPAAPMQMLNNDKLDTIAKQVSEILKSALDKV